MLGTNNRHQRLTVGPVFVPDFGEYQPLGWRNLAKDTAHPHVLSVVVPPDKTQAAAGFQIHLAHRQSPIIRSVQPALNELSLGPGLEDQVPRSVKDADHGNLAVAGRDYLQRSAVFHWGSTALCVHVFSPLLSVLGARHLAAGSCLPRCAGIFRSTLPALSAARRAMHKSGAARLPARPPIPRRSVSADVSRLE